MTTSRRRPPVEEDDVQPVARTRTEVVEPVPAPPEAVVEAQPAPTEKAKRPLYPRLLRLRHIQPNAWQRAALGEGAVGAGVLLSMADLASAWSIVALPVAVAVVVKAHDALQGLLDRAPEPRDPVA